MTLGQKIAALRKEHRLTQHQLAEKLGAHGNNITRWESDRFRPTTQTLQRLAEIFEVSIDELLADDEAPSLSKDKTLADKVEQLRFLDPEDRAVIYHIIETYAAQKRMTQMANAPRPRLEELRK